MQKTKIMDIEIPTGRYIIEKDGDDYVSICNDMPVQTTKDPEKAMKWLSGLTYGMGSIIENMKDKGIEIVQK